MRRFVIAVAVVAVLLIPRGVRATDIDRYKPEIFEDPAKLAKEAGGYFELDEFEDVKKKKPRKLAVTEFVVEFVTGTAKANAGTSLLDVGLGAMGVGKKSFAFSPDLKPRMTQELYDLFIKELENKGFQIVDREELVNSPFYQAFVGQMDPKKKIPWTGPGHASGGAVKAEVYSPPGMKDLPWRGDAESINEQNEAKLIEGMGIDGVFHAKVVVSLFKAKYPAIEIGTKVSHRLGFKTSKDKKSGEIEYGYKDWGDAELEAGLYIDDEVQTGKEFESGKGTAIAIDEPKFERDILRIYTAVARMAATGM